MKATFRIPAKEQYGYVELEFQNNPEKDTSAEDWSRRVLEVYDSLCRDYKGGEGLPDTDFNHFIDRQLLGEDNHVEEYQKMSEVQKGHVQMLKKALKRLKYKNGETNN